MCVWCTLIYYYDILTQKKSGNTNGSNFEVYALLGKLAGSGCPLGYVLIQSSAGNGGPGGKECYIKKLLAHFKNTWALKPIITLTDKDMSEINAFLDFFLTAKHQLCFWHCLRAIKTRLSILRQRPKFYNVKEAMMEFPWMDKDFVPCVQAEDPAAAMVSLFMCDVFVHSWNKF